MTSQKYIQSLIDDIDAILPKAEARLPWSKPGDVAAQRRVLERVRSYLVSEQQNLIASPDNPPVPATPEQQEVLQQIVQVVTQEMDVMRVNLMQPLQADIKALHQQRESLVQEIRQLERTKQQLDSITYQKTNEQEFISELSQGLIKRCSENLTQQLSQILANWEVRLANMESSEAIPSAPFGQTNVGSVMHSQDRLEQLQQLQEQSDRLLTNLDANQRSLFEALQRNLQGYQESLSQGLEKMHRLGVQGETLFTALVNRLAQQLGREASTLLQSSLQLSDSASARQPNEAATRQTTAETLLPTNALKGTESSDPKAAQLTLLPNLSPEQTPLQPVQSVEQLDTEQASALSAAEVQKEIPDATAMPLRAPQTDELPPLADTRSQMLDVQSGPTDEDRWLENLNAVDWEIIEGLDFGNLDLDSDDSGVDTFIQLDIDSPSSLLFGNEIVIPSPSETQQPDFRANTLNEKLPTVIPSKEQLGAGEVESSDEPNKAAQLDFSSDSHRQEIDELYESLFGSNALSAQVLPDELDSGADAELEDPEQKKAQTDFQMLRDDHSSTDLVPSLSSEVEEVLFEGLVDPSAEHPQAQLLDCSEGQLAQSWNTLFFEDSVAGSSTEIEFAGNVQEPSLLNYSLSESQKASDQEGIKTIATLTDLVEEMGLSHSLPIVEADSLPVATDERSQNHIPETDPQASLVEDSYIPASPEEDLLLTDELESEPDREILLDENTLQKLSEDLFSFEDSESQNFPRQEEQRSLSNYRESLPVTSDADRANQENLRFPMWEELLAEDWEEFALNDLSEQASISQGLEIKSTTDLSIQEPVEIDINQEEGIIGSTQRKILDSAPTAPESVEPDFDLDLFSSEALELDQEKANVSEGLATQEAANSAPEELSGRNLLPARSDAEDYSSESDRAQTLGASDLTRQEDLNTFEDEAFVEMLWEEQIDSAIEEMISSSELEFESNFFLQKAPNSQFDRTLNPDEEVPSEKVQGRSLDDTQDTTLPTQPLDKESDSHSQKKLEVKQKDELASDSDSNSEANP